MYRRILVPLDGSALAETALPLGEMLAQVQGAELHLVHAVEPLPDYSYKTPQDDLSWEERATGIAMSYLEEKEDEVRERGMDDVRIETVQGRPSEALAYYCGRNGIDLVVMSTHGESGLRRAWLGSVADELLRSSQVPILFHRPGEDVSVPEKVVLEEVLVPLDGSPEGEAAVNHALEIAESFGARLDLMQVRSPGAGIPALRAGPEAAERSGLTDDAKEKSLRYLSGVAAALRERSDSDIETTLEVVGADHPADGILEKAKEADLVAMATHGRGGFARMVVGSVADKVLRGGTGPLLLVRTPGDEESAA